MHVGLLGFGGIELLQLPLATKHAGLSDFVTDFFASCLAIGLISGEKIAERYAPRSRDMKCNLRLPMAISGTH
jgi:hypothetical protein